MPFTPTSPRRVAKWKTVLIRNTSTAPAMPLNTIRLNMRCLRGIGPKRLAPFLPASRRRCQRLTPRQKSQLFLRCFALPDQCRGSASGQIVVLHVRRVRLDVGVDAAQVGVTERIFRDELVSLPVRLADHSTGKSIADYDGGVVILRRIPRD